MNGDLVSIITPTYNCGRFISDTIESVLAQTYPYWELIIVDDCSSDDTFKIVEQYLSLDSRIKYFCLECNSGAAIARNTALKLAKGRWIAFLDSDDFWHPDKLSSQISFMEENGYSFSSTEREFVDETGKRLGIYVSGPSHINKFAMHCYCWLGCLTVMYDAYVVGLIQITNIKKNNDYAMWLKVVEKADCYLLKRNLAFYRVRKGSISHDKFFTLIKSHYILFRKSQGYSVIVSILLTMCNLVFGLVKKIKYVTYQHVQ